jgi:hypothetical protein
MACDDGDRVHCPECGHLVPRSEVCGMCLAVLKVRS